MKLMRCTIHITEDDVDGVVRYHADFDPPMDSPLDSKETPFCHLLGVLALHTITEQLSKATGQTNTTEVMQ